MFSYAAIATAVFTDLRNRKPVLYSLDKKRLQYYAANHYSLLANVVSMKHVAVLRGGIHLLRLPIPHSGEYSMNNEKNPN